MEECVRLLKKHGLKVTSPRLQILRHLRTDKGHPTADEVFSELKKSNPSLSRTTVYNTLDLLRSKGIIKALTMTEKELRYEMDHGPHHHFCCKLCGMIIEVKAESPELEVLLLGRHEVDDFQGYYRGTCEVCLRKGKVKGRKGDRMGER